jgi:hypothetical protein
MKGTAATIEELVEAEIRRIEQPDLVALARKSSRVRGALRASVRPISLLLALLAARDPGMRIHM